MTVALAMVVAPLTAATVGLLLGGLSRTLAAVIAISGPLVALILGLVLAGREPWRVPIVDAGFGISSPLQPLPLATSVDGLAIVVALMVGIVALLVQIYSVAYLRGQPRYSTYASFINFFAAAMLVVVVAGDLVLLVVGWEVMGLCSYLLIGYHWEERDARAAAMKAFLVTKAADVGFIVGIVVLIGATGTLRLPEAVLAASHDPTVAAVAASLILVGVFGKSAQFPLHTWLPDAMAGPSPVSALIHAATMVAAGVYVVARMYPMYLAVPNVLTVLAVLACITMLGAAVIALGQTDIKRVLAWSTISQLAYMMAALSVGSRDAAIFHLLSHAFFKALLFLAAGVVILAVGGSAFSSMHGLRAKLPVTFVTMTVGLLALVGVFPFAGFFSKESVLVAAEHAADGDGPVAVWVGWMVLLVAVVTIAVTAAYALRLWMLTWGGGAREDAPDEVREARDRSVLLIGPLVLLALGSVAFGALALSRGWLSRWIHAGLTEPLVVPSALNPRALTVIVSTIAIVVGALGYLVVSKRRDRLSLPEFVSSGFGIDAVYNALVVKPFLMLVAATSWLDSSVIGQGVSTVGQVVTSSGRMGQRAQRGDVQKYLSTAASAGIFAVVIILVRVVTA